MSLLSDSQLAQMQVANQERMFDTCTIRVKVPGSQNAYGEYASPTYTETPGVRCGFEFSPFKFRSREIYVGAETSEILVRCRLPLVYYDTIGVIDMIRLTHRFGVALTTAEDYEVQGFAERGPSAIILNLKRTQV